jgi:hypothetical protein
LRGYRKGYVAAGIVLIIVSFPLIFGYIAPFINRQYGNVTTEPSPINVSGLAHEDPLRLIIFAILSCSGVVLLVKGFL